MRMCKHVMSIVCIVVVAFNPLFGQEPSEIWVSAGYDSTTIGWDSTHFAVIQDGINAVAEAGTVNVASGTYYENVIIEKSLNLIGESEITTIDGQGSGHCVSVNGVENVSISGFTFTNDGDWTNWCVILDYATNTVVSENHFLDKGIGVFGAHNNNIVDNVCEGQASILLGTSWGNLIEGNQLHVSYPGSIWLLSKSNNNVIADNIVIGDEQDASCTGIRSAQSSNNLYRNNTTQGFRVHILLTASNNNILTNNNISGYRWNLRENGGGIVVFRGNNNTIINNEIDSVCDGGITLFGASCNNMLGANIITNAQRGIELYYDSDDNSVINNRVSDNPVGIILDNASRNTIYHNNFTGNEISGYDDGDNVWDYNGQGNYWSDYPGDDNDGNGIGDTPYMFSTDGKDDFPFLDPVDIVPVPVPEHELVPFVENLISWVEIDDHQVWANEEKEIIESHTVKAGGSLTLNNVDLTVTNDDLRFLIEVDSGGTLQIYESKIISQGASITAFEGASVRIENSELEGIGLWDAEGLNIQCNGAVIKNNIIKKAYAAIIADPGGSSDNQIIDNHISEAFTGIRVCCDTSANYLIENNHIYNMIGSAIFSNGLTRSTITGNTFQDIWNETILLARCDCGEDQGDNIIYGNNFINCGTPFTQTEDQWHDDSGGNYWSDYLDRYPNAQEHPSIDGVWNIPYTFVEIGDDFYPLMCPVYHDTVVPEPGQPLLLTPADGSTETATDTTLQWQSSSDATSYRLQASENSDFSSILINDDGIEGTTYSIGDLKTGTSYYWRVIALNNGCHSGWSETWSFVTLSQLPDQVALISPPDGELICTDSAVCEWSRSQPLVSRYGFALSSDSLMTNPLVDSTLTDTAIIIRELVNGQTYWWRTRAGNAVGWGPFSETWKFNLPIVEELPWLRVEPTAVEVSFSQVDLPSEMPTVWIHNAGCSDMSWTAANDSIWLTMNPSSGSLAPGDSIWMELAIGAPGFVFTPGDHQDLIIVDAPDAYDSPDTVTVFLTVQAASSIIANNPNPFNPSEEETIISLGLQARSSVEAEIYDLTGGLIHVFDATWKNPGETLSWNGRADDGPVVGDGVYLCHLRITTEDGEVREHVIKIAVAK